MAITDIIAQINEAGGLSRPNRFSVQIAPPALFTGAATGAVTNLNPGITPPTADYFRMLGVQSADMTSRLDFMCNNAEFPSRSFGTTDARTYGSTFKMPHVDTYADFTLSFIVGSDMVEKDFFDAWVYSIQDPESADFNYVAEYATTVDIYQLDEFDTATYGVRAYQCWPVALGQLKLAYDDRNTYHVYPVTFTFRKWINLKIPTGTPTTVTPGGSSPTQFENTVFPQKK
jgi:hypothetical protein